MIGIYHPTPCQRCRALITHNDTLWRADGTGGVWFNQYRQPNHMRCIKNGGGTNEMERMMNLLAGRRKPKALDLFCGAGGAGMGLHRAGFDVVGVDIAPQSRYPFEFVQADALTYPLDGFDLVWASPVCKRFSSATRTAGTSHRWDDQIAPIRQRLVQSGLPYIIENVAGAPLLSPLTLCGAMFGLRTYRHRLFESNVLLLAPPHPKHTAPVVKMGRPPAAHEYINPVGHFSNIGAAREAMGIEWMNGAGLSQAIPPAYSEYLGRQIIQYLSTEGVAA